MNTLLNEHIRTQAARQRLRRSRALATGLLLLAAVLFVLSVRYQPQYPALGYLKAFSEAAMVGALADWFAVTALFRRPLGLPIPHTAILPRKQARIADELGRFVAHNFLHGKSIALRVYRAQPADKLLAWLMQPQNKALWLPWLSAQIPLLLRAAKPNQVARFGSQLLAEQYQGAKLGAAAADLLGLAQQQGIDRRLLHSLATQLRQWLQNDSTRAQLEHHLLQWAGKIDSPTPSSWDKIKASLKTSLAERVDDWVAAKALDWADGYLAEALADEEHDLWQACQSQLAATAADLRHNAEWHQALEAGKRQLAASEALHRNVAQAWQSLCQWSAADVQRGDASAWQAQLDKVAAHMLSQAARYPAFMRRLNARMAWWVKSLVDQYRHQGAQFVADNVKSWDSRQMVDKIELGVGRDLQFIRINGTLVGGLAGLLIYVVAQWLGAA